jgi:hypothetical protein
MDTHEKNPTKNSISQSLASLDKFELIDLLQNKTLLLVTATLAKVKDKEYIRSMRKDVEDIQLEIKSRMDLPIII